MDLVSNKDILILLNRALEFIVYVSVIAALIAYFTKKYAVVKVIKNIFAVIFIVAGVGNEIYFIVSMFLGEFRLYNLTLGFVLFISGTALKGWKLPTNTPTSES